MTKEKYSILNSPHFAKPKNKPTREQRHKRLKTLAGYMEALLWADGDNPKNYTEAQRAKMWLRRSKKDLFAITAERARARMSTLRTVERES